MVFENSENFLAFLISATGGFASGVWVNENIFDPLRIIGGEGRKVHALKVD